LISSRDTYKEQIDRALPKVIEEIQSLPSLIANDYERI
jgi:hypothetical protein